MLIKQTPNKQSDKININSSHFADGLLALLALKG